jgi:hypothetical protein
MIEWSFDVQNMTSGINNYVAGILLPVDNSPR